MSTLTDELDQKQVEGAVQDMYEEVATFPENDFHFPTGRNSCLNLGYPEDELNTIPASAVESFAGVGYPFLGEAIKPGDTVLDIGSGSGVDAMVAALKAGTEGLIWGIDITPAMIEKARKNLKQANKNLNNIRIIEGRADDIPLEDSSIDVVISNGVINLVPDKEKAFKEIYRVVKPGGHIQIADIVLSKPVSKKSKANAQLWAECIVGAEPVEEYLDLIRTSGFENVTIIDRLDYFERSSNENTRKVANNLGAHTIVLTGQKG